MKLPVIFRAMVSPQDDGFIYNAWLKSYKDSSCGKTIVSDIFYSNHKEIVRKLIEDPNVSIVLAVNPDNTSQIYGFAAVETTPSVSTVHYVYTKYSFIQLGLARAMISEVEPDLSKIKFITHLPRDWREIATKYKVLYHPYLLPR